MQNFQQQSETLVHFLVLNELEKQPHVLVALQIGDEWKIQRVGGVGDTWEDVHPAVIENILSSLIQTAIYAA